MALAKRSASGMFDDDDDDDDDDEGVQAAARLGAQ